MKREVVVRSLFDLPAGTLFSFTGEENHGLFSGETFRVLEHNDKYVLYYSNAYVYDVNGSPEIKVSVELSKNTMVYIHICKDNN